MNYKIGTRGSQLALAQAMSVKSALEKQYPAHIFELEVVKTTGDKFVRIPMKDVGTKGMFVKELEEKLLDGSIDLAVHSMKDMPTEPAGGLQIMKVLKREDPRDALILASVGSLSELREHAVIGTGSLRRKYQLLRQRPDLQIVDIRGNVQTRIRKMQEQNLDGIVLAAAGLKRLHMEHMITQYLTLEEMVPAPAQGALAVEINESRSDIAQLLMPLTDQDTDMAVTAERKFLKLMGGGCQQPVGAIGCIEGDQVRLDVMYSDEQGEHVQFASVWAGEPMTAAVKAAEMIRRNM